MTVDVLKLQEQTDIRGNCREELKFVHDWVKDGTGFSRNQKRFTDTLKEMDFSFLVVLCWTVFVSRHFCSVTG